MACMTERLAACNSPSGILTKEGSLVSARDVLPSREILHDVQNDIPG